MWAALGVVAVLVFVLATGGGLGRDAAAITSGVAALLAYLALCWWRPFKPCPSCGGDPRDRDSEGNYRRFACWRCGGAKDYPRVGARLMGRDKR